MIGSWRVPIALLSTVVSIECFQSLQLFTSSLLFFGDHVYTGTINQQVRVADDGSHRFAHQRTCASNSSGLDTVIPNHRNVPMQSLTSKSIRIPNSVW